MTKYLLKSSPKNEQKQDSELSSNEIAFQNLIHEINDDLVVHKKVFRMTQLLEKYKAYLPANTDTYSSAKIQDRLVKHYAGSIVIRGQGMSNLVVSDKLSSGDSIGAAGKYKSKLNASELENDFEVNVEGISYEQLLHSAVGILRRDIEKLKISVGDYPKKPNYSNLNKFRVRLAAKKRRKPRQITTMRSDIPSACTKNIFADLYLEILTKSAPPVRSPLMFGWEDKSGLVPVLFLGQMSSDFLQDLVCSCKGKSICFSSCVCFEQNLSCTDLCPCYGSDTCKNAITNDDGHDV
jgi:hypothetical protein